MMTSDDSDVNVRVNVIIVVVMKNKIFFCNDVLGVFVCQLKISTRTLARRFVRFGCILVQGRK